MSALRSRHGRALPWSTSGFLAWIDALVRCGSSRFAAYYYLSFAAAMIDGGARGYVWAMLGIPFWFLHSFGTELLNRYADRTEDRINRPERTALCDLIGYDTIKRLTMAIWAAVALSYGVWLTVAPNPILAVLLAAGFAAGICYSVALRFKAHRYLALIALTFPFGGPFLIGWAATHGGWPPAALASDLLLRLGPFLLIGGLFFLGHAGIKDITDIAGDESVGYRSLWVALIRRRARGAILTAVSLWAVATSIFATTGMLPVRFLLLLALWPLSAAFARAAYRAAEPTDRAAVRELFYHYWFVFLLLLLLLFVPSARMALVALATAAYWVVTSQHMHWTPGLTLDGLGRVLSIARTGRAKGT